MTNEQWDELFNDLNLLGYYKQEYPTPQFYQFPTMWDLFKRRITQRHGNQT